jgi:hypothetical protein
MRISSGIMQVQEPVIKNMNILSSMSEGTYSSDKVLQFKLS